jgi:HSP20 family protein
MALNLFTPSVLGFHDFPLISRDPFADLLAPDDTYFRHTSPGYEINETVDSYQISIDVPGIKSEDMNIDLENNGKVLRVTGSRKFHDTEGKTKSESKFLKRFTIGSNIDVDHLTANLADGVLVLKAPKQKPEEKAVRRILITEGPTTA